MTPPYRLLPVLLSCSPVLLGFADSTWTGYVTDPIAAPIASGHLT